MPAHPHIHTPTHTHTHTVTCSYNHIHPATTWDLLRIKPEPSIPISFTCTLTYQSLYIFVGPL